MLIRKLLNGGGKHAISCRFVINYVVKATCAHFMYISQYCHGRNGGDDVGVAKERGWEMWLVLKNRVLLQNDVRMYSQRNFAAMLLTFIFIIRLGTCTIPCFNNTACYQTGKKSKCCNGTCLENCNAATDCKMDTDCPVGQKCCDSGECISRVSLCSLSSKLAVAIPLSLLFCFVLVLCVCANHSSCPVYATQQRRRLGVV